MSVRRVRTVLSAALAVSICVTGFAGFAELKFYSGGGDPGIIDVFAWYGIGCRYRDDARETDSVRDGLPFCVARKKCVEPVMLDGALVAAVSHCDPSRPSGVIMDYFP